MKIYKSTNLQIYKSGISLIEILVVVGIFAIIGTLVARSVILTLRGTAKSEASVRVRENLNYALAVMERQLRSADSITAPCTSATRIDYKDYDGNSSNVYFECKSLGPSGYIASGSARLTSSDVSITNCNFTCSPATQETPVTVSVNITGRDATATGVEAVEVSVSTTIIHRNF